MTSEARKETQIPVEWEVVDASNGLSIDFGEYCLSYAHSEFCNLTINNAGGSVMKIVYLHKDDWIENKSKRSSV